MISPVNLGLADLIWISKTAAASQDQARAIKARVNKEYTAKPEPKRPNIQNHHPPAALSQNSIQRNAAFPFRYLFIC